MSQFWLGTFTKELIKKNEWNWCMILPIKTKMQQVIVYVSTSFVCEFVDFANYDQNLTSDSLCEYVHLLFVSLYFEQKSMKQIS